MSLTFECSFEEFKRAAREFHDAVPTLDRDGLENGFKALSLMYLGMREEMWRHSAAIVLKIASGEYWERSWQLEKSPQ